MTAFTPDDLPKLADGTTEAITTVEQLAAWAIAILAFNNATDSYTEAPNTNRLFRFINPTTRIPDGQLIRVNRAALVVNEVELAEGKKAWQAVDHFSNTVIPASFKVGN